MGDGPEDVHARTVQVPQQRCVFHCDQYGEHKQHHQYFERLDGTVADIVWLAESDRGRLTTVDSTDGALVQSVRSKVTMNNPRLPQAKKKYPNVLDGDKPKVKLERKKVSAEDW